MTLHTPTPRFHLPETTTQNLALDASGPTFVFEAILGAPAGQPTTPAITVPGWSIRAWPVARLGDVTVEAHAHNPQYSAADLSAALRETRITPLGPIRARHT